MSKLLSKKEAISKLNLKQKKISAGNSAPGIYEGYDGELTIRNILGQGIFLFYKTNGRWYSSRFSQYTRTTHERNEPVYLPKGRKPKSAGEITLDKDNKIKIRKTAATSQILSVDKNNVVDTNNMLIVKPKSSSSHSSSNSSFQIHNEDGDARIWLQGKSDSSAAGSKDSWITFMSYHTEGDNIDGWVTGLDTYNGSDSALHDSFVWNALENDGGTTASDVSTTKMSLSQTGNLTVAGTITSGSTVLTGYGGLNNLSDVTYSSGDLTIDSLDKVIVGNDLVWDIDGDVSYELTGNDFTIKSGGGTAGLNFNSVGSLTLYNILDSPDDYFKITPGQHGATTIITQDDSDNNYGTLTIQPEGTLVLNAASYTIVNKDTSGDGAEDAKALHIDFDRTVATSGTAAHNDIGIDLDVNSSSLGTSSAIGMDIDVVGGTGGTHTATGIDITVSGSDTNQGLNITAPDGLDDYHIRLFAADDASNDYGTISVKDTGDMYIATVGNGTTDSDLHLDVDGLIKLDAAVATGGGGIQLLTAGTKFASFEAHHSASWLYLYENAGASTNDYFNIKCEASGATTIATGDAGGEAAHLTLDADGEIFLEPVGGGIKIKETDDKVTETAAYGQLWVKDDNPNTLWFTDDGDNDYQITPMTWTINGADPIYGRYGSVNNYYISNQSLSTSITAADWTTFKFNYAQFTAITPVVLKSWYFVGEFSSAVDWEIELWDLTIPSNGTAAASTAAKVGSTQSVSATAYAIYTLGETGLSYTVAAGHQLYVVVRYTSGSGTKYSYGTATMEFSK